VIISAMDEADEYHQWAEDVIVESVASEAGAGINPVIMAELSAGRKAEATPEKIKRMGLYCLDLPFGTADLCGRAFRRYLENRKKDALSGVPKKPLPEFFYRVTRAIDGMGNCHQ
jgi:hypothetical protein